MCCCSRRKKIKICEIGVQCDDKQMSNVTEACAGGTDEDSWTPLMKAAYCGDSSALEIELKWGADVHYKNEKGQTPLKLALECAERKGLIDGIILLLLAGACVVEEDKEKICKILIQEKDMCIRGLVRLGLDPRWRISRTAQFNFILEKAFLCQNIEAAMFKYYREKILGGAVDEMLLRIFPPKDLAIIREYVF
jgi:hypothetical protein